VHGTSNPILGQPEPDVNPSACPHRRACSGLSPVRLECRAGRVHGYNGLVVYRDAHGVEYDSVPLLTHEVTDAVAVDARIVRRTAAARKPVPLYTGSDGAELAQQPRGHRRQWTDRQWLAFEEHRHLEKQQSSDPEPIAAVMIVRPHDPTLR